MFENFCYIQHTAKNNEVKWKCINYKIKKCNAFLIVDKQQLARAMVDRGEVRTVLTIVSKDKFPHTHCAAQLVLKY